VWYLVPILQAKETLMRRHLALLPIGLIAVALLNTSGCAFGTRHPTLSYAVGTEKKPANDVSIYIESFLDERLERDVIGHVRNGWGMKTAEVVTTTSVPDWIATAMQAELENSGYTVTDDPKTDHTIRGEVIKVYCDSYMSYDGVVGIGVTLQRGGENLFTRKYLGNDSSINMAATAKSYGRTLERSLQKALVDAIHDIDRALAKD
jgi:hypothetical protein